MNWFKSLLAKRKPNKYTKADFVVEVSETSIVCHRPDGQIESVNWDDMHMVLIEINDDRPYAAHALWILIGAEGGCVVPWGATGERALLERLQMLAGVDNQAVIAAASSTQEQYFLYWEQ